MSVLLKECLKFILLCMTE